MIRSEHRSCLPSRFKSWPIPHIGKGRQPSGKPFGLYLCAQNSREPHRPCCSGKLPQAIDYSFKLNEIVSINGICCRLTSFLFHLIQTGFGNYKIATCLPVLRFSSFLSFSCKWKHCAASLISCGLPNFVKIFFGCRIWSRPVEIFRISRMNVSKKDFGCCEVILICFLWFKITLPCLL